MVFSLGRIVGRRFFAKYLTSAFQNNEFRKAFIDRGIVIVAALGGCVGSYTYNYRPDAAEDRTETPGEARRRQEAEARAKRFEELKAEFKSMNIDIEKILPD